MVVYSGNMYSRMVEPSMWKRTAMVLEPIKIGMWIEKSGNEEDTNLNVVWGWNIRSGELNMLLA